MSHHKHFIKHLVGIVSTFFTIIKIEPPSRRVGGIVGEMLGENDL